MRLWTSAVLIGVALAGARPTSAGDADMPIKNMRLPLDRYDDGKIKMQLVAAQAKVPPEGEILAKQVRLEFYKDDRIDALMTTDECRYDRVKGTAKSESQIRIEQAGVLITGTGFECNMQDQTMKILHNAKVVLDRPKKDKGKGTKHAE